MARQAGYLKLTLRGDLVEDRPELALLAPRPQLSFHRLLRLLEEARRHRKVRALFLVVGNISAGWSEIQEIHRELDRFHEAGKQSVACLEHADNKLYYLACGAQKIFAPPPVTVDLVGLRAERFFLKNLLEYLGIQPQLFALGEYKSAAEMFTQEQMSAPNRSMTDSILSDLHRQLAERVAAARSVEAGRVQEWVDGGPYTARQALARGLIDGLYYEDEVEDLLRKEPSSLRKVPAKKLRSGEGFIKRLLTFYRPQIAYLVADGVLAGGESRRRGGGRTVVGAETLVRFLRDARKRKRVKAVVLRVNSPGGSALASDLLRRQIRITNRDKPVIVSFGNVAASGGYYLATAAHSILGMPATLTGSIGVIHGKFSLEQLMAKVGITVDSLDKGKRAGYTSATRAFSEDEAAVIQDQMREFYEELFLKRVADNRGKTVEEIRKLAEGRVWTGQQASDRALVDQIGGLLDAFRLAQQEASLPPDKRVRIIHYAARRSLRDLLPLPLSGPRAGGELLALMGDDLRIF